MAFLTIYDGPESVPAKTPDETRFILEIPDEEGLFLFLSLITSVFLLICLMFCAVCLNWSACVKAFLTIVWPWVVLNWRGVIVADLFKTAAIFAAIWLWRRIKRRRKIMGIGFRCFRFDRLPKTERSRVPCYEIKGVFGTDESLVVNLREKYGEKISNRKTINLSDPVAIKKELLNESF